MVGDSLLPSRCNTVVMFLGYLTVVLGSHMPAAHSSSGPSTPEVIVTTVPSISPARNLYEPTRQRNNPLLSKQRDFDIWLHPVPSAASAVSVGGDGQGEPLQMTNPGDGAISRDLLLIALFRCDSGDAANVASIVMDNLPLAALRHRPVTHLTMVTPSPPSHHGVIQTRLRSLAAGACRDLSID